MTTFTEAEQARQRAVAALRAAGLTKHADKLAALPPITDSETAAAGRDAYAVAAYAAADAYYAARAAWDAAFDASDADARAAAEED